MPRKRPPKLHDGRRHRFECGGLMSFDDIAALMGLSKTHVRRTYVRAMAKLADAVAREGLTAEDVLRCVRALGVARHAVLDAFDPPREARG